jgi:hypothetical protein
LCVFCVVHNRECCRIIQRAVNYLCIAMSTGGACFDYKGTVAVVSILNLVVLTLVLRCCVTLDITDSNGLCDVDESQPTGQS